MCKILKVSRKAIYSYQERKEVEDEMAEEIINIFHESRCVYGTRKIKVELGKKGHQISRRRISRIMKASDCVSVYTSKKYRNHNKAVNEQMVKNLINREFNDRKPYEVIVSDLTYERVNNDWNYICVLLDLHNREFVGYSCGERKDAGLVYQAFSRIKKNLSTIQYFHSDRGSEFDNYLIDEVLETFKITRSLSHKGCPYDNAVAEAQFKIIKTEFVRNQRFESLEHLESCLSEYIEWFNTKRIHSTLGYLSPVDYKETLSSKFV